MVLLLVAGFAAGLAGSVAGIASLISYPALLAAGLPPVTANVTNTVALVFSGIGAALGSRPELHGQGRRLWRLGLIGMLGGATGGALLLLTPSDTFEFIVPWLIALASIAILLDPRPQAAERLQDRGDSALLLVGVFLVAIYGGYFGAAAGVVMFALLLAWGGDKLARSNALKNAVLALANAVAALAFIFFGPVRWSAVAPLATGFLAGGLVGPALVRRTPARLLRVIIAVAGLALAIRLGSETYS